MNLKVLGSSSRGNCYILENETEALVIECGVPLADVKRAIDFNIKKISGCVVSHEHLDHAKFVKNFIDSGIRVYMSTGTARSLGIELETVCGNTCHFKLGGFHIMSFYVNHDAEEPLGFLINHKETGTILFATDTSSLNYQFKNLSNILIECNYRIDLLKKNVNEGYVSGSLMSRTIQNHMDFGTCLDFLKSTDLSVVNNIVLLHLSDKNSNAGEFVEDIIKATGKNVFVADKGLNIELNKTPF